MDLIILNDGIYHLIPVTKKLLDGIVLTSEVDCFDVCEILRLKLTGYVDTLNLHIMNDGGGSLWVVCVVNLRLYRLSIPYLEDLQCIFSRQK